eukprot:421522-Rhodomonas_salina.2
MSLSACPALALHRTARLLGYPCTHTCMSPPHTSSASPPRSNTRRTEDGAEVAEGEEDEPEDADADAGCGGAEHEPELHAPRRPQPRCQLSCAPRPHTSAPHTLASPRVHRCGA